MEIQNYFKIFGKTLSETDKTGKLSQKVAQNYVAKSSSADGKTISPGFQQIFCPVCRALRGV